MSSDEQSTSFQDSHHPLLLVVHRPIVPDAARRGLSAAIFFLKLGFDDQTRMIQTMNAFFRPHFEEALVFLDDFHKDNIEANFYLNYSERSNMSSEESGEEETTQDEVPSSTTQLVVIYRPPIPENVKRGLYAAMSYMDMAEEGRLWMQRTVADNFRMYFDVAISFLAEFLVNGEEIYFLLETTDLGIIRVAEMTSEYLTHFHLESRPQVAGMSEDEVNNIPKVNVTDDLLKEQPQCVVCLEEFLVEETTMKLICNHIFHASCLKLWVIGNRTCPCCRREL